MSAQPPGTLRLSEAAKVCGVTVDVVKRLIETGHLDGVVRAGNGHVYLRADAVPQWDDVAELLENRLRFHIGVAAKSLERVKADLAAVELDLAEATEHPLDELGYDAASFSATVSGRQDRSFGSALLKLQMDLGDVALFGHALRQAHRVQ